MARRQPGMSPSTRCEPILIENRRTEPKVRRRASRTSRACRGGASSYGPVRVYGMLLSQVAKTLKVCKQSLMREVEQGRKQYPQRGWGLGDLITELSELRSGLRRSLLRGVKECPNRKGSKILVFFGAVITEAKHDPPLFITGSSNFRH